MNYIYTIKTAAFNLWTFLSCYVNIEEYLRSNIIFPYHKFVFSTNFLLKLKKKEISIKILDRCFIQSFTRLFATSNLGPTTYEQTYLEI